MRPKLGFERPKARKTRKSTPVATAMTTVPAMRTIVSAR